MSKVAIVILNWNGKSLLEQFLPSVTQYSKRDNVEVIVADNNSSDDSIDFLKQNYPAIKYILLPENYGYAEGYNQALKQISADYFILLNSDVEVTENWLNPIVDHLDNNIDVVALQPKILAYRNKTHFEHAGASGGFIDKYGYPFCRGRILGSVEQDEGQYDDIIDIFWATGACLVIRAKDFFEAGGFDGSFFAHMEEIDLCWRLHARGKRIVCIPQSVVYHVGGATLNEESPRKLFLNFRNSLLMLYKNLSPDQYKKIIKRRLILDHVAILRYTIAGKRANAKAILNAHKEFNAIKSNYNTIRQKNLNEAKNNRISTIYSASIVADYYRRSLHKFSQLKKFSN